MLWRREGGSDMNTREPPSRLKTMVVRFGMESHMGVLMLALAMPFIAWNSNHTNPILENWFLMGAFASLFGGVFLYIYLVLTCGRETLAAKILCVGLVCFDGLRFLRSILVFNAHYWTADKVAFQLSQVYLYAQVRVIEGMLLWIQPLPRATRVLVLALTVAFDGIVWGAAAFESGEKRLLLLHNGAPFLFVILLCIFCQPLIEYIKADEQAEHSATIKDVEEVTKRTSMSGPDEGCVANASSSALKVALTAFLLFWIAHHVIVPWELELGLPIFAWSVII